MSNLDKFRDKLDGLIQTGREIFSDMTKNVSENIGKLQSHDSPNRNYASMWSTSSQNTPKMYTSAYHFLGEKVLNDYQQWYTESSPIVKQLIHDRFDEFSESYFQDDLDALLSIPREEGLNPSNAVLLKMRRQCLILMASKSQLDGAVSNLRQIVQADLFDSELDAARELLDKGFTRAAGALAAVALERSLNDLMDDNGITFNSPKPTIGSMNEQLKSTGVYGIPVWRRVQWFADIRNQCDHVRDGEPKGDDVKAMIDGIDRFIKTGT